MSDLVMEMVIKGQAHTVRIKDEYGVMDRSEGVMAIESGLSGLVRIGAKKLSQQIHAAQQEVVNDGIGQCGQGCGCQQQEEQGNEAEITTHNQCHGHGAGCCCYGTGTGNC